MTTTLTLRPKRLKSRVRSDFFFFDYRNEHHQHYCGKLACRKASKLASERRWLRTAANRDYFRWAENPKRVGDWRQAHPGYWKRKTP